MRIILWTVRGRKKSPQWANIAKEVERTLDATIKPKLLSYGERVTASWDHKVKWMTRKTVTRGGIGIYMWPASNADIWTYVSRGTKPHRIPKVGNTLLAFPTGYAPHTKPSGPSYNGPGRASGPVFFAMHVKKHPGNKGRHFEEAFGRWIRPIFRREVENAMRRGARK